MNEKNLLIDSNFRDYLVDLIMNGMFPNRVTKDIGGTIYKLEHLVPIIGAKETETNNSVELKPVE